MLQNKVFVLIFIILMVFGSGEIILGQQKIDIQLEEIYQINSGEDYILGSPDDIVVSDRFTFISDPVDMKVKVFSKDGEYLRSIGGRGRGPGEFSRITSMWLNHQEELFILDYMNAKICKFDSSGELLDEFQFDMKEMRWPRTFHQINDQEYLVLYKTKEQADNIFHIWDKGFQNRKKSFSLHPEVIGDDILKKVNLGLRVGPTLVRDSTIIYVPFFYEGKIYSKYVYGTQEMEKHTGKKIEQDPYTILERNNLKNEKGERIYDYRIMSPEGTFPYWLNSTSKGIFQTEDGFVVNFIEVRNGDWKEQGIEVYDHNLEYQGYESYKREKIKSNSNTVIPLYPKAMDSSNRIYMTDYQDKAPVVKVYQLKIEAVQ